jgi:formylglycine-generating enzyme required for sulfatase activity
MRAATILLACLAPSLAVVVAACAGSEPPPPPPAPTAQAAPAPTAQAAPAPGSAAPSAAPTPAPTAQASAEPAKPASPCPANMALVPGGTFTMATPSKHEVTLKPLCMDLSETTADEYTACTKAGKCSTDFLHCAPQATYEAAGKGNHPIVCVDFAQAESYCKSQNKRLATDEEWEWAAHGAAGDHAYPWGNDKPAGKACWSGDQPLTGTCAVGSTPGGDSPQGIHDLAGNVFEWVTSKNDKAGADRVGRGGSWRDGTPEALRAARPGSFKVTYRCGFLGIRCVAEPK